MRNINKEYFLFLLPRHLLTVIFMLNAGLMFNIATAATLIAKVDKNVLGLDETFVLTLQQEDHINTNPDYDSLKKDFDILNIKTGVHTTIINGRTEKFTQWTITLAPKKIGTSLIPAFNINDAISEAIEITLEDKNKISRDTAQVNIEIDKTQVFIGEQLIVKLRLTTHVEIPNPKIELFQIKNSQVFQVDEKKYRLYKNKHKPFVYETTFAVFPQHAGKLIIPSVLYQVEIDENNQKYFFTSAQGTLIRPRTDEKHIDVKEIPDISKAQPWLPAKDISIEEYWSSNPDAIKAGQPITRTLKIRTEGLSASQLPTLSTLTTERLNTYQYEIQAKNDDIKNEQGIIGIRTETTKAVFNQPGSYTIPEIIVYWWDTDQKTFKTLTTQKRLIIVSDTASSKASNSIPGWITVPINSSNLATDDMNDNR